MKEELIGSAIDLADEIQEQNRTESRRIIDEIYEKINIKEYNDINTSVFVMVGVRKGRDIYSSGSAYHIKGTMGYSEYDVYKFKLNANEMLDSIIRALSSEE